MASFTMHSEALKADDLVVESMAGNSLSPQSIVRQRFKHVSKCVAAGMIRLVILHFQVKVSTYQNAVVEVTAEGARGANKLT